ncbi:MAG: hypothetical protein Q4E69_05810 [Bacilli bacterium]|nr:hypothetical protein [Bacilli bacterium]
MNNLVLNDDVVGTKRSNLVYIFSIIGISILLLGILVIIMLFTVLSNINIANKTFVVISAFGLWFLGGLFLRFGIIRYKDSKKGNYLIVEDIVKSKNTITDEMTNISTYYINLEELDNYDIHITVDVELYERCLVGSKVYLIFYKGIKIPKLYLANTTTLDNSINDKLVTYKEILDYCNIKEKK